MAPAHQAAAATSCFQVSSWLWRDGGPSASLEVVGEKPGSQVGRTPLLRLSYFFKRSSSQQQKKWKFRLRGQASINLKREQGDRAGREPWRDR